MASDYREHLDAASLRLLAETTGFGNSTEATQAFQSRPQDIRVALASREAARLLHLRPRDEPMRHRLLQLAIAVHRTADDICQAGWSAADESAIDLNLVSFSGQTEYQQFIVGLLTSYLRSPVPPELEELAGCRSSCDMNRFYSLIDLCNTASETERAGALRLLGDEALFTAGMFPGIAHEFAVDRAMIGAVRSVLPRALVSIMDELEPQLRSLLDVHLLFGPVWYQMAAQNLLHSGVRVSLNNVANNFETARRFIVQISQGPLASIKHDLYPEIG